MSADLLAAFGKPGPSPRDADTTDDDLGSKPVPSSDALIPELDVGDEPAPNTRSQSTEVPWRDNDPDVLFDGSTEIQDGEEFGDFENGVQEMAEDERTDVPAVALRRASQNSIQQSCSLLDLEQSVNPSSPEDEWGDFSIAVSNEQRTQENSAALSNESGETTASSLEPKTTASSLEPKSSGKDREFLEDTMVTKSVNSNDVLGASSAEALQGTTSTVSAMSVQESKEFRPINIPPPTILLQMLTQVFLGLANETRVRQPVEVCHSIIRAYVVASRIIAGRSLRWKRDKILNQSTKIGPAAGGKGGGMKLASIDKAENLKEEREVADVFQAWERHANVFNSTTSKAGIRRPLMGLSSELKPRSVRAVGVLSSQHACALCGLKRDERLPEADIEVDDSFDEFWVERWGHTQCKDFWQHNRDTMKERQYEDVKDQHRDSMKDVKDQHRDSMKDVKDQHRDSMKDVKDQRHWGVWGTSKDLLVRPNG